jgi:hypothetical protein
MIRLIGLLYTPAMHGCGCGGREDGVPGVTTGLEPTLNAGRS